MKLDTIKRTVKRTTFALLASLLASSCSDYLNVVPDSSPTLDHAFADRNACEGYLFTCYSYLPPFGSPTRTPEFMGSDEFYTYDSNNLENNMDRTMMGLSFGLQNANNPIGNIWDGHNAGQTNGRPGTWNFGMPLYNAIRDCNIFLENVHRPYDLPEYERKRWSAEVKFLKAFYHFYLMRFYGPIVLVKENQPTSNNTEQMALYRSPFDECVDYVSLLLDEAAADLPDKIEDRSNEMGRATKSIALSVKAQLLTMAASPLFNGNPDYVNVVDNKGIHLFDSEATPKIERWQKAANACKAAIEAATNAGEELLEKVDVNELNDLKVDVLKKQYYLRAIVTNRWNKEIIWGSVRADYAGWGGIQELTSCKISTKEISQPVVRQTMAPSFDLAEAFYTKNGIPMDDDKDYPDKTARYDLRQATTTDKWFIREGEFTADLHFDREPRFYAALGFDRAIWWGNGAYDFSEDNYGNKDKVRYIRGLAGGGNETAGKRGATLYSVTGYWAKKLNNPLSATGSDAGSGWGGDNKVSFPIIRVADLYLMYAETLNETVPNEGGTPPEEAYTYIDKVRARAGLDGVKKAWQEHSHYPDKPLTKEGFRKIVHQERQIELAMEGPRFWDLRRWKKAVDELNKGVRTWNINGETKEDYYKVITVDARKFAIRDYLWPIKEYDLTVDKNLEQNYGWK